MTAAPLPQCEDCSVRPAGRDERCAWCIAPGRYRRDPFSAADGLPPWLSNAEVDRTRRRTTVEAILRNYRPDQVNWSAVASLLGVSRQAVHQLKRRLVEAAARPPVTSGAVKEALVAAAQGPQRRARSSAAAASHTAAAKGKPSHGGRRGVAASSTPARRRKGTRKR
jgi:hypothetical protein